MTKASGPDIDQYAARAREWLAANLPRRAAPTDGWGSGSDSVALLHSLSAAEERALIDDARAWHRRKADAGYGSIDWSVEDGGAGLGREYARAFAREEAQFATPPTHESIAITLELVGPTIRAWGDDRQRERYLRPLRRTDEMWCQLFSEPGAGSDLARLSTRAVRDGNEWVIHGQKVWTSGAQYAEFGYIICRTDPAVPKHRGLTAFIVPMRTSGVEARPLRQMTGGASFNEVFFDGARVGDDMRLGGVGDGWRVAMTTLGFERAAGAGGERPGGWSRVRALAEHLGVTGDTVVRQRLAALYTTLTVLRLTNQRVAAGVRAGQTPGPEGSIGKLAGTEAMRETTRVVSALLGPRLVADTREWGTFAWSEYVNGAPGYRIAAGSDEVQRNIIGERVLGLPAEPRVDRDVSFGELIGEFGRRPG
ncbi:MAG: acyl-CoA dehydrogenase family protein [Desertimonas sp.]